MFTYPFFSLYYQRMNDETKKKIMPKESFHVSRDEAVVSHPNLNELKLSLYEHLTILSVRCHHFHYHYVQVVSVVVVALLSLVAVINALPDGYKKEQLGRVKIQVYRGPSKGKGYHVFAPWGYYFTQPEDYKKGYHH